MKNRSLLPLSLAELSLLRSTSHEHPITLQRSEKRTANELIRQHLLERHPTERKCVRATDAGERQAAPLTPHALRVMWRRVNASGFPADARLREKLIIAQRIITEAQLMASDDPNCIEVTALLATFQKLVLA